METENQLFKKACKVNKIPINKYPNHKKNKVKLIKKDGKVIVINREFKEL